MGTEYIARNPDGELPTGQEWSNPTMSWRLYAAFIDLISALGGDTTGTTFANDGEITEEQATDWAARLRAAIPGARRYVVGRLSWFEVSDQGGASDSRDAAIGGSVAIRSTLIGQSPGQLGPDAPSEVTMEDPEQTRRWLTFVADYLEHSGGIIQA